MLRFRASRHLGRLTLALAAASAAIVPFAGLSPANARAVPQVACIITVTDDSYSTPQDTPLTVDPIGVVSNDNICGTSGLVISETQPTHGTLSDFDDSDGGFTYTPDPGFTGTDSFTYSLEDVEGSPIGTVTITVSAPATHHDGHAHHDGRPHHHGDGGRPGRGQHAGLHRLTGCDPAATLRPPRSQPGAPPAWWWPGSPRAPRRSARAPRPAGSGRRRRRSPADCRAWPRGRPGRGRPG